MIRILLIAVKWLFLVATLLSGYVMHISLWAIHIITVLVAYRASGVISAIITFAAPGLAQIYWFISVWHNVGSVNNWYTWLILSVVIGMAVAMGLGMLYAVVDVLRDKQNARRE